MRECIVSLPLRQRKKSREQLHGIFVCYVFTKHCKHGVGSGYCAENFGRLAHVDVVGKSAGISVACLYHSEMSGELNRYESGMLPGGSRRHSLREHSVLQVVAVGDNIHVVSHVGSYFGSAKLL